MNGKGKWLMFVASLLFAGLITVGSYWAAEVRAHRERLGVLDMSNAVQTTEIVQLQAQLDRIENKVDRLLEK